MNKKCAAIFLVVIFCLFMPTSILAGTPAWQKMPLEKNEYFVETNTGVTIYVVEKKLRRTFPAGERKAVLLIHGFGIGYAYYDLEYKDYSMMEHLARNGFDVFAVDQRGYGQSSPVSGLSVRAEQSVMDLKSGQALKAREPDT